MSEGGGEDGGREAVAFVTETAELALLHIVKILTGILANFRQIQPGLVERPSFAEV